MITLAPPDKMVRIVNGSKYETRTACLIAGDDGQERNSYFANGRTSYLYRTEKGNFFKVVVTCWAGENDILTPCNQEQAVDWYNFPLTNHRVSFQNAFPGIEIEEA